MYLKNISVCVRSRDESIDTPSWPLSFLAGKIFLIHPYSIISRTGAFHKEFDTDRKPHLLKKALERCEAKGWIVRVRELDHGKQCWVTGSRSVSQRYVSGSFYHQAKIVKIPLIPTVLWLLYDFLSLKNDVNVLYLQKNKFFVAVLKFTDENSRIRSRIH